MGKSQVMHRYMDLLLQGNRAGCRDLMYEALQHGTSPETLYFDVLWPAMEKVDTLFRDDQINVAAEHMATRINRFLADQIQRELPRGGALGKRVLVSCADGERQELGAQMCADLFEARGWDVFFVGGGVPNDEILALVGKLRPDLLLIYGMTPQGVPDVRAVIDLIRDVGVCPTMNVLLVGGVFNRAADLWKEINADLYADCARRALHVADEAPPRVPEVRLPGAPKKRRRRRRPPLLTTAER